MTTEEWRDVHSYEGAYEVSNLGRVRRTRGRIRSLCMNARGYLHIRLSIGGAQSTQLVHRLVLSAFVGPSPDGLEGSHLDGDTSNNAITNLVWETRQENHARKVEHGTVQRGESHHKTSLSEIDVHFIRFWLGSGYKQSAIARVFNISRRSVSAIKTGQTWSWIGAS